MTRSAIKNNGAVSHGSRFADKLYAWRINHIAVAQQSLRKILLEPISSMLTIFVLAIAMALPAVFFVGLENLERLMGGAKDSLQMTLYLQQDFDASEADSLVENLRQYEKIKHVKFISSADALAEFEQTSGFAKVLDGLNKNPLPAIIILTLSDAEITSTDAEQLRLEFEGLAEVEVAKFDLEWLKRVQLVLGLIQQIVYGLGFILGLGVMLVVGNTIRMAIDNRSEEIVVTKLVGATNAFIRRPFLYMGLWYGIGGAILANAFLIVCSVFLIESAGRLSAEFQGQFIVQGMGFDTGFILLISGSLLGLLGAWLATTVNIRALEPK